jgi:hypothetical protein
MPKPTSKPAWVPSDDPTKISEPSSGKKAAGFIALEKPTYQQFNWLLNNISKWIDYFEQVTDQLAAEFNVVVGDTVDDPMATHATLQAAINDVSLGTNVRVLVKEDQAIASTIQMTKNNWRVYFAPGVTFTKSGVTTGIQISASGVEIIHGRFSGFSTSGDVAIEFLAGGNYGRVLYSNFINCDTEIDDSAVDAGKRPLIVGTISE